MLAAHGRLHTQQLFNDGRQYSEERRLRRLLLQYGQMAHKEPERSGDLLGCEIARERALLEQKPAQRVQRERRRLIHTFGANSPLRSARATGVRASPPPRPCRSVLACKGSV